MFAEHKIILKYVYDTQSVHATFGLIHSLSNLWPNLNQINLIFFNALVVKYTSTSER